MLVCRPWLAGRNYIIKNNVIKGEEMIPLYSIDELRDVAKYGKNKKIKIYGAGFRTDVTAISI